MSNVKEIVNAKIAGKKVMVFSKTYCPYCTKGKDVLKKYVKSGDLKAEDYEVWEIENEANCEQIQAYLGQLTGGRSVPRVFINGKCIGGGDETAKADGKGELKKMLTA